MINLLFPPKCVFCRCYVHKEDGQICKKCADSPNIIKQMPLFPPVPFIKERITATWYVGNVRKAIHRFKFNHYGGYARLFAKLMYRQYLLNGCNYDIIVWVPSNKLTVFKRGYNQAELLAIEMGKISGVPVVSALKKLKSTKPMYNLSVSQRRANVLGVYGIGCPLDKIVGKRILIVDDIFTTGATVSECAAILLAGGAVQVGCCVLAHKK